MLIGVPMTIKISIEWNVWGSFQPRKRKLCVFCLFALLECKFQWHSKILNIGWLELWYEYYVGYVFHDDISFVKLTEAKVNRSAGKLGVYHSDINSYIKDAVEQHLYLWAIGLD